MTYILIESKYWSLEQMNWDSTSWIIYSIPWIIEHQLFVLRCYKWQSNPIIFQRFMCNYNLCAWCSFDQLFSIGQSYSFNNMSNLRSTLLQRIAIEQFKTISRFDLITYIVVGVCVLMRFRAFCFHSGNSNVWTLVEINWRRYHNEHYLFLIISKGWKFKKIKFV